MARSILIVDDDPVQLRILEGAVRKAGFEAHLAHNGDEAMTALGGPECEDIAVVVLDLVMPDLDGMGVLAAMRARGVSRPVIVQTAHGGIETVVSAMRAGAVDFVVKPVSPERLEVSIRNAIKLSTLEGEVARMRRRAEGTLTFADVITRSPAMRRALELGRRAATSQIPVMFEGESGVGKEVIARAIQGSGPRRGKPFVPVNCGAIPDNLIESTLFGHERGSFTGATERHVGKFVEADGGTLFLDEVGELPPDAQVKLLRALQAGEVDPVGARRPVKTDFRLVSATNRSMIELVQAGRFREDLYYRLNVFPIIVPPLRQRVEDIPLLVRHFVTRFAAEEGKHIDRVTPDAMALLARHRWPGNVRQLENAIFRAVVLADGPELGAGEFSQLAGLDDDGSAAEAERTGTPHPSPDWIGEPVEIARPAPSHVPAEPPRAAIPLLSEGGDVRPLEEVELELIRFALDHYRGRMSEVARKLGIGRSTLYRRLRDLDIEAAE